MAIAINTRQLPVLISKHKSSINWLLQLLAHPQGQLCGAAAVDADVHPAPGAFVSPAPFADAIGLGFVHSPTEPLAETDNLRSGIFEDPRSFMPRQPGKRWYDIEADITMDQQDFDPPDLDG
jgi:hypothetical protein